MNKYYLFGDERIKFGLFSFILYVVTESDLAAIIEKTEVFKKKHRFAPTNVFHYNSDTRSTRNKFTVCIKTLPIQKVYRTNTKQLEYPTNFITCFEELITKIVLDFPEDLFIPFIDRIGGKKSEEYLRTEFRRLARKHKLQLHKPLRFLNSRKSTFIQIADYLVVRD